MIKQFRSSFLRPCELLCLDTSPYLISHLMSSSLTRERRPPILAVTIGIDTYASQEYDNLHGAAGDADAFEAFLKTDRKSVV